VGDGATWGGEEDIPRAGEMPTPDRRPDPPGPAAPFSIIDTKFLGKRPDRPPHSPNHHPLGSSLSTMIFSFASKLRSDSWEREEEGAGVKIALISV